jgi:hypothetical protein
MPWNWQWIFMHTLKAQATEGKLDELNYGKIKTF